MDSSPPGPAMKPPIAFLHDFRPLTVGPSLPQERTAAWLGRALTRARGGRLSAQDERAVKLYERLGRGAAVRARASVVKDYARELWSGMTLFRPQDGAPWHRPPLQARMALYEDALDRLARAAFPRGERAPDWLIQVSCTGYASPHAVQRAAARRGWRSRVLHLGHMGCYAALPAADMAARLVRGAKPGARAALLVAELTTLHLKPGSAADEQVVINSLFGDGAVRFDVSAAPRAGALALLASDEAVLPGTGEEMTWRLEGSAFGMSLSRAVPGLIGGAVAPFTRRFLAREGLRLSDVARFAVHPGGPRVIESVLAALRLPADAARHSRALLARRGNMSSATLPHVWDLMLKDRAVRRGERVLSLAFGPGLTMAANLLRKT